MRSKLTTKDADALRRAQNIILRVYGNTLLSLLIILLGVGFLIYAIQGVF